METTEVFKANCTVNKLIFFWAILQMCPLFKKTSKALHQTKEQIFHFFSNGSNFLINVPPKQNYQPAAAFVDSLFVWHGAQETAWQTPWLQGCLQDRLWCNHGLHKEILLPSGRKQMWELQQERKIIHEISASTTDAWKTNQGYFSLKWYNEVIHKISVTQGCPYVQDDREPFTLLTQIWNKSFPHEWRQWSLMDS